jgi:hypothetical protein
MMAARWLSAKLESLSDRDVALIIIATYFLAAAVVVVVVTP